MIAVIVFVVILVEVDMEEVEHDPVHGGPQPGAEPPDAGDHPLDQALLVIVGVHGHEGGDGGVGDGANARQYSGTPHHPGLRPEPVPGTDIKTSNDRDKTGFVYSYHISWSISNRRPTMIVCLGPMVFINNVNKPVYIIIANDKIVTSLGSVLCLFVYF